MLMNGWPLVVYFFAVASLAVAMVVLGSSLGERHVGKAAIEPFESGVVPVEYARVRLSAKFYLVAMFFVIFDLEAVFIFAWAISARDVGWAGYAEMLVFIGILIAALAYLWRLGALDWAPESRSRTGGPANAAGGVASESEGGAIRVFARKR